MKRGDLLLVKPGTHVPPGARYSSGLVLEVVPRLHAAKVAWFDSVTRLEDLQLLERYYERITREPR